MAAGNGTKKQDVYGAQAELTLNDGSKVRYVRLDALEKKGLGSISRLPYSIKILLESVLRNLDGFAFTEAHVKQLTGWQPKDDKRQEIPFKLARVVLQDFTGVPAVVDLAAMRDAVKKLGGDLNGLTAK